MTSETKRYYVSQLLAIPLVMTPGVLGGLLLAAYLCRFFPMPIANTIWVGAPLACLCSIGLIKLCGYAVGSILIRFGMLPDGAAAIYPANACSWDDYLRLIDAKNEKPNRVNGDG